MKINPITLSRLRNDANFQFHTEFKELAEKQTPEALKIEPQFNAYLPLYEKVDLESNKYAPDVAKVGLVQWVAELKARNNAFAVLVRDRVDEGSVKVDIVLRTASLVLALTLTLGLRPHLRY